MQKKNAKNVRLSKNIVPVSYNIQLKPDLKNFTFSGIETITLSIKKSTKVLTLHSKDLEIDTAEIQIDKEKTFAKISYNEKSETATFTFPKIIKTGKYKLTLVFKGILNNKMRGFYKSSYHLDGKEHHIATTQFEATDARRAFPCFDEPAHKAVFYVSLMIPKGKTAISNTLPISVVEHESGFEIIKFHPTPKMSTYLLAFIVGDFEYLEKKLNRGAKKTIRVRVYTTPGKKHQAKFALDVAVKVLEFYEKYFDIKYPLDTLDMIAIPDFSSGAMENWGAITYRESAILFDENNSSTSNKQWVALVIAHEIAHQWFGNLVTMEWWTHLWLNEGFASYIEYLAVDKLFPKWNIWTQFITNDLGVALNLDALKTTHPIEVEVHHPDEIGEIFDAVSYSKGASVIRMLAEYLGEKDFCDGLRYYLKKHSYKNTETIHLWQAFEKVSKKPKGSLTKMMQNWTSKPGYPVIKAQMLNGKINFSQSRFFASPISAQKYKLAHRGGDNTKWEIPIIYKHNKVNFGETGFFRTAYTFELLEKLKIPVQNKSLPAPDRLGIIRDLFALSEAGTIPTTDALEFLSSYKNEDNFIVWAEIATGLTRLTQILPEDRLRGNLDKLILDLFSPTFHKLGWNKIKNENHTDALLRSLVISRLGKSGHEEIILEAKKQFQKMNTGMHIDPDIRGAIYGVVATYGDMQEYKILIKKYIGEHLHEEKNRIGSSLGNFRNPKILKLVCEFAISKNVRIQDTISIMSSVGTNPLGRDIWWNFIKKNWKTFVSRYGEGGLALSRAITAIGSSSEERHYKEFKKFFATHEAPGAKRSIDQVLERLEGNIAWRKRDQKIIANFLKNL